MNNERFRSLDSEDRLSRPDEDRPEKPTRYAVIEMKVETTSEEHRRITAYMPDNYKVWATSGRAFLIVGEDVAGWTLDDYVIPRLASGLTFAREITQEQAAAVYGYEPEPKS